jgi:hypothetical protein
MKCPFCNHELTINDFFDINQKNDKMYGNHTAKEFKGKQIYGIENTGVISNLRTLHRFWECPYCQKLLQITESR